MAARRQHPDSRSTEADWPRLLPISDTVNGTQARVDPVGVIAHYGRVADQLWPPPQLSAFAQSVLDSVRGGRTAWASLSGPYGFGKTAAGILLWRHALEAGFLAIPPLSCTNYDEFASGVAALAELQAPKGKTRIRKLAEEVRSGGFDHIALSEAKRHELPVRKLRKVLEDQFRHGRWTPDGHSHRLVEFLARLGELAAQWSHGLVVIVDELQQLLGPLDVSSLSRLREFVWGMRTEQSPCAVVLSLDTQLETRLAQWAADLLHRVREHSPALQMTGVFTREFPRWLWEQLSKTDGRNRNLLPAPALSHAVLESLGQFVERPDLSNGPRTVVDVFNRAADHFARTGECYDIPHLVDDLHQGRFRFFGEGTPVQRVLTQLLSDSWIQEDSVRSSLVRTLAAFPRGCPTDVLHSHVGNARRLKVARDELFGPLLVELREGLALEPLQQVSRGGSLWERALARCWDSMPGIGALAEMMPELVSSVLLPRMFPGLDQPGGEWSELTGDARVAVGGYRILRGSFDPAFPEREIAIWISDHEPDGWLEDVDLCVGLVCRPENKDAQPSAFVASSERTPRIVISMPALVPFDGQVPPELVRYEKYLQPEPIRPAYILLALRELQPFSNSDLVGSHSIHQGNGKLRKTEQGRETFSVAELRRLEAFREVCLDHVLRFLVQGEVDAGVGRPVRLRGPELLRALFSLACRQRYASYQTLFSARHWKSLMLTYRSALMGGHLSLAQRRGQEDLAMPKAEAYKLLFNQVSTAAGDSFIRSLGALTKVTTRGESWSIRFSLHPGETALLGYLRGCGRPRSIPRSAASEFLRHKGYVEDESDELTELLKARELIHEDSSHRLRLVSDRAEFDETARKRIAEARQKLIRLSCEEDETEHLPESSSELGRYADRLEAELQNRVSSLRKERESHVDLLRSLVGDVRSTSLPDAWLPTGVSTHLSGIGDTLRRSQSRLINSLRKELRRIDEELSRPNESPYESAVLWIRKQKTATAVVAKLRDRTAEFERQRRALIEWVPANQALYSAISLCDKVEGTDPAPAFQLRQLVSQVRERFSTKTWEPLFEVRNFLHDLVPITRAVQALLYSKARAFYRELETLRSRYGTLLPVTPPPEFDGKKATTNRPDDGYATFAKLYGWAIEGFQHSFNQAKRLKENGIAWSDPRKKKRSWNELASALESILAAIDGTLDFKRLMMIGEQVSEIVSGFGGTGLFDNPDVAPDFDAIRDMFRRGEVVIRVEPKR